MNIKYATSEVQNKEVFGKNSLDDIIDKFSDVLGTNILVLDIENINSNIKIQVESIDYNERYIIEFDKLRDHIGSTNKYEIVISNEQKTYYVRYLYQYNWHGYNIHKNDENYINEDVLIRKKFFSTKIGYINYVIFKENKKVYLTLAFENEQVIRSLLRIRNIDLKEIYNLLKKIDSNLVLNLSIKIVDENTKFKENIDVKEGVLTFYNKEYLENDTLVILEYKDNEVIVTKVKVYDNVNLDVNNFDSELEKVKIKTINQNN